jgi:hypothetical protein
MNNLTTKEPDIVRQINDAVMDVLRAADHLVDEYTREDCGYGTGVGMRAAEDRLITKVKMWRSACRGGNP